MEGFSLEEISIELIAGKVIVQPFTIKKFGNEYRNPDKVIIDPEQLLPGEYKIVAVHNFQSEDLNPDLSQCLAGIFLSLKLDERNWYEAETFPCECRTLSALGILNVGEDKKAQIRALE